MKFTVITVCLNPGEKLKATLDSVLGQTCTDVEVVLKDGGSTDGSVEEWLQGRQGSRDGSVGEWRQRAQGSRDGSVGEWRQEAQGSRDGSVEEERQEVRDRGADAARVRIIVEKDKGIYDAMNQAAACAKGEFILFLNCGDVFYDNRVLERALGVIEEERAAGTDVSRLVLYGDTYSEKNKTVIASPPVITGFTCYRNIPCHQSCFYAAALCREKPYDLRYQIRADYDHFLWCFYRGGGKMRRMDFPVASYEGGGYSEDRGNRKRDREEHERITRTYMSRSALLRYGAAMACTLAPLRSAMAESRMFSGIYHRLKKRIYH